MVYSFDFWLILTDSYVIYNYADTVFENATKYLWPISSTKYLLSTPFVSQVCWEGNFFPIL